VTTYTSEYPIFKVTADVVLLRVCPEDHTEYDVLLVERAIEPFKGQLALPGGHLNIDEKPEVGARRECNEETGIDPMLLHFVCMLDEPGRDPRGRYISYLYTGWARKGDDPVGADDASWAGWIPVKTAMRRRDEMAFDHSLALERAIEHMRTPR
jgi:8-oxo-dGTP diphosphatase